MSVDQCQHCSEQLSTVDYIRSPFCEKPNCQRAKVQHYLENNKKQLIEDLTHEVTTTCNDYIKTVNDSNEQINVSNELAELSKRNLANLVILPVNTNPLVTLTEQRKNEFLLHLTTIYIDIIENRTPSTKVYTTKLDKPLEKEENELLGKACATCKGECCSLGNNHAFQDTVSLGYYLERQSEAMNLEKLTFQYSQYFPSQNYKNACVFQGSLGCTLPSELRSFTCKNYRCSSLRGYHQDIIENDQKLTFAAAAQERDIKQISVFDAHTFLMVKESNN
jgi:DNA-directed RNA polymerase beta' subunit